MTNHIEQALASLKPLFKPQTISAEEGNAQLQLAQAYASIAIAEQLRIANLIGLSGSKTLTGSQTSVGRLANEMVNPPKDDIAEALGLGGDSDE